MSDLLAEITVALVEDLSRRYPCLQVMRNGVTQITLFRPLIFEYAQVVVGDSGIYMIVNHTKDTVGEYGPPEPTAPINRGPMELAEPTLFCSLYQAIDTWLSKP